jgi:hypothetical protein
MVEVANAGMFHASNKAASVVAIGALLAFVVETQVTQVRSQSATGVNWH